MAPIQEFPPEKFSWMLRIMVEAPFRDLRQVLPHMYAQGCGRVVKLSSIQGVTASPYKSAYLTASTRSRACRRSSRCTVQSTASPATASTRRTRGRLWSKIHLRSQRITHRLLEQHQFGQVAEQAVQHGIPEVRVLEKIMLRSAAIKRLIEPEEIAEMIAYLCGPHASFITGSHFMLDCGWTAQ
jgi:3-hydroxybutyrate dehydrogenase